MFSHGCTVLHERQVPIVIIQTCFLFAFIENLDYSASDKLSPVILHGIQPHSPTVIPMGHPHLLYCSAVGDGEIHYKWFRNDKVSILCQ